MGYSVNRVSYTINTVCIMHILFQFTKTFDRLCEMFSIHNTSSLSSNDVGDDGIHSNASAIYMPDSVLPIVCYANTEDSSQFDNWVKLSDLNRLIYKYGLSVLQFISNPVHINQNGSATCKISHRIFYDLENMCYTGPTIPIEHQNENVVTSHIRAYKPDIANSIYTTNDVRHILTPSLMPVHASRQNAFDKGIDLSTRALYQPVVGKRVYRNGEYIGFFGYKLNGKRAVKIVRCREQLIKRYINIVTKRCVGQMKAVPHYLKRMSWLFADAKILFIAKCDHPRTVWDNIYVNNKFDFLFGTKPDSHHNTALTFLTANEIRYKYLSNLQSYSKLFENEEVAVSESLMGYDKFKNFLKQYF